MKLIAWRNTVNNPVDDPRTSITIGVAGGGGAVGVYPWVLPLGAARELLGDVVDTLTEQPIEIRLKMEPLL